MALGCIMTLNGNPVLFGKSPRQKLLVTYAEKAYAVSYAECAGFLVLEVSWRTHYFKTVCPLGSTFPAALARQTALEILSAAHARGELE